MYMYYLNVHVLHVVVGNSLQLLHVLKRLNIDTCV